MIAEINQTEKWHYSAKWQRGMPHGNQMTYKWCDGKKLPQQRAR